MDPYVTQRRAGVQFLYCCTVVSWFLWVSEDLNSTKKGNFWFHPTTLPRVHALPLNFRQGHKIKMDAAEQRGESHTASAVGFKLAPSLPGGRALGEFPSGSVISCLILWL